MRSRHFYYAFLILDSLYRVCYYNVVGKISLQDIIYYLEVIKMSYEVYVNGKLEISVLSIEDLMYYIQVNGLSIIEENEDLENNVITIDCEEL